MTFEQILLKIHWEVEDSCDGKIQARPVLLPKFPSCIADGFRFVPWDLDKGFFQGEGGISESGEGRKTGKWKASQNGIGRVYLFN